MLNRLTGEQGGDARLERGEHQKAEGKGYQPRIPVTWCFTPRDEVTAAVASIDWELRTPFKVKRTN